MKTYIFFIIMASCALYSAAQQTSHISFEIRNVGISVDGHFNTFNVLTSFDATNNLKEIRGEVNVKSIITGIQSRDEHLLEEDYFYASKYPSIYLQSTTLNKTATNQYTATVNVTIKGKTKQIRIPITVELSESFRNLSSEFEIDRRDFAVGGRSLVLSNTVKVIVFYSEEIDGNK